MQAAVDSCFFGSLCQFGFANWWIVLSADGKCLVVDIEPTGVGVTKVGKAVYQTQEQAETDAKPLCKETKPNVPHEEKDQ